MLCRLSRTVILFAIVVALPVSAQPAQGAYYFDCDAPATRFSLWKGPVNSESAVRVTGLIEMVEARPGKGWFPVASVVLGDPDAASAVGLQVLIDPRSPKFLQLASLAAGRVDVFGKIPKSSSPIPFTLSLESPNKLTIAASDSRSSVAVDDAAVSVLSLACSSGEFKFVDVLVQPN